VCGPRGPGGVCCCRLLWVLSPGAASLLFLVHDKLAVALLLECFGYAPEAERGVEEGWAMEAQRYVEGYIRQTASPSKQ